VWWSSFRPSSSRIPQSPRTRARIIRHTYACLSNGTNPAIDAARKQGVKIISVDTNIGKEHYDSFVGVDNGKAAQQFGRYMLKNGFAKGTKYGVVDARNSEIQNLREDKFKEVVNAAGATFTQAVSGENQNEKAATAAENLLTAQQDLDFVYTTGTPATLGATSVLSGHSSDRPKVVGWDLSKEIIKGIDDGIVQAVVQQDSNGEGVESVKEMKRLIDGEKAKGEIIIPITIVTKDNVDQFRALYK
ncbi:substrate-binding domain-containing protein, partial [Segeticoccus rhizosphaerae]|uniref:substrate-binding domain-containing protein n=1 Tax=Segeticoccus rhizosphaerae TaxID=1104777 RepID=UPI001264A806